MTAVQPQVASDALQAGQRVRLPGETGVVVVRGVMPRAGGVDLFVAKDANSIEVRAVSLTSEQAEGVRSVAEDGAARPEVVLAGLWNEWMLGAVRSARSTVLASTMLKPYPHQMDAVYGHMLTQPLLRFLLADEPGTGKTIMLGLWLREAQRLGLVRRALVVCQWVSRGEAVRRGRQLRRRTRGRKAGKARAVSIRPIGIWRAAAPCRASV